MIKSEDNTPQNQQLFGQIAALVRRSPGLRGTAYLAGAVALYEIVRPFYLTTNDHVTEKFHLTLFPMVAALTYGFTLLEPNGSKKKSHNSFFRRVQQTIVGAGMGGSALLTTFAIMKANGWLSTSSWGWESHEASEVARSVALSLVGHAVVAWNEEQIFRGYGYTTLRQAMPPAVAAVLLSVLFGFYHGFDVRRALAISVAGLTLALLRTKSDGIWLPLGYHWAWNIMQTAIFGPDSATPSIRPVAFHGPTFWIGSPGRPELGALAVLVMLLVGSGVAYQVWKEEQERI